MKFLNAEVKGSSHPNLAILDEIAEAIHAEALSNPRTFRRITSMVECYIRCLNQHNSRALP